MATSIPERQTELVSDLGVSLKILGGLAVEAAQNFPREHPRLAGAALGLGIPFALHGVAHAQEGQPGSPTSTAPEQELAIWGLVGVNIAVVLGSGARAAWRVQGNLRVMDERIDEAVVQANQLEQATPDDLAKTYELLSKLGKIQHGVSKDEFVDGQLAHKDENMKKADKAISDLQWVRRWKAVTGYAIVVPAEAAQGFFVLNGALLAGYYAKDIMEDFKTATIPIFKSWLFAGGVGMLYLGRTALKELWAVGTVGGAVEARASEAWKTLEAVGVMQKEQKPQRPKREGASLVQRVVAWWEKGRETAASREASTGQAQQNGSSRRSNVKIS